MFKALPILLLVAGAYSQGNGDLDSVLNQIFGPPPGTNTNTQTPKPQASTIVPPIQNNSGTVARTAFCEAVMLAKEEARRVEEQTSSRPSRRERHSGRRGSRDDLRPPTRPVRAACRVPRAPQRAIRPPQIGPRLKIVCRVVDDTDEVPRVEAKDSALLTQDYSKQDDPRHNLPYRCNSCKPGSTVDTTMKTPEH
uniref:SFRICE_009153 n=1 Tax=Spodoptera frugiperda TaxID=7108 RepID=A0A2H1W044_SPOFR